MAKITGIGGVFFKSTGIGSEIYLDWFFRDPDRLLANLNAYASPSSLAWTVSGELIVMVVLGGIGTAAGPIVGALVFLGLEEVLKGLTEHWMAIFGPLIVVMALVGRRGIVGLFELWPKAGRAAVPPVVAPEGGA